jgi:hypothetical protein
MGKTYQTLNFGLVDASPRSLVTGRSLKDATPLWSWRAANSRRPPKSSNELYFSFCKNARKF